MKSLIRKFFPDFLFRFLLNQYHFLLAFLGAVFYGFPSKRLMVIGVTGTNGKSTTVYLITKILEQANHRVASISSIKFKIREKEWLNDLKMTMPGRFKIQRFLKQAVNADCQYAILEVTSEGIKQHRHRFIDFNIAVFTNLTPEHIESHGSFEKYREAKLKLFKNAKKIHILNLDDKNIEYFLELSSEQKFCYSADSDLNIESFKTSQTLDIGEWKFIKAVNIKFSEKGIDFAVDDVRFCLNLLGGFNVYNALAAICAGMSQGIDLQAIKRGLERASGIPGRMEAVIQSPFQVVVDYAHTPDSLEKVYQTLSSRFSPNGEKQRLICVLGACGGGRDKWKRPVFGEMAAKYCDQIIITNEDPYDEDPTQILSQIKSGIQNSKFKIQNLYEILNRREAVRKALNLAKPNDIVIITGKGCELWMCVAHGKKIPWDDRKIVEEEFKKLNLR